MKIGTRLLSAWFQAATLCAEMCVGVAVATPLQPATVMPQLGVPAAPEALAVV